MCPESTPPSIPPDAVYTSCYCEENIYLLAQTFSEDPDIVGTWDIFVVFISNYNRTVRPPPYGCMGSTILVFHRLLFGVKSKRVDPTGRSSGIIMSCLCCVVSQTEECIPGPTTSILVLTFHAPCKASPVGSRDSLADLGQST